MKGGGLTTKQDNNTDGKNVIPINKNLIFMRSPLTTATQPTGNVEAKSARKVETSWARLTYYNLPHFQPDN